MCQIQFTLMTLNTNMSRDCTAIVFGVYKICLRNTNNKICTESLCVSLKMCLLMSNSIPTPQNTGFGYNSEAKRI